MTAAAAPTGARPASRIGRATRSLRAGADAVRMLARPAVRAVRRMLGPVLAVVTPTGWAVIALAALSLGLGFGLGWQELTYLGLPLLAALLIAAAFLVGRASYGVLIELNPRRVVVGDRAMGRVLVTNTGPRPLSPSRMELPVGRGVAEFELPAMRPGQEHEELFSVPTHRRAVIPAGPAESVRGDALGLLRRAVRWSEPVELFVHPRTVRLASSAAGLVRDLEGQVSRRITSNDIAFHALRPYVAGDDRRNVHWRTSARIGQLMVRQYEETRRSQVTLVHLARADAYASEEEFELAVSVTASIAAQLLRDGTQMSVVGEIGVWRTRTVVAMLDASCRVEPVDRLDAQDLREIVRDRVRRLPYPSVVMTVVGSGLPVAELRGVQSLFGQDVAQVAVRVAAGAEPRFGVVQGVTRIEVGSLEDLPRLVRGLAP